MITRPNLLPLLLIAAAVLVLAACGGDDDEFSDDGPTPSPGRGDLSPGFTFEEGRTACDILTDRIAASAIDNATADPAPSDDGFACTWTGEAGELALAVRDAGSPEAAMDALSDIDKDGDEVDAPGAAYFTSDSSTAGAIESYVFEINATAEKGNLDVILENITQNVAVALTSE